MTIDCASPSELLDQVKCLQCLTEKELLAVLVLVFAIQQRYDLPSETNKLLEDSACLNCLTERQLFQAIVSLYANSFATEYSVDELREQIKCLLCAPPRRLKSAFVYLLCQYLSAQD